MSIMLNKQIIHDRAQVDVVNIKLTRNGGEIDITVNVYDDNDKIVDSKILQVPKPAAILNQLFSKPELLFDKIEQWVQNKIGGTIQSNPPIVIVDPKD